MSEQLIINLDATSLGYSSCLRNYKLSVIDGYREIPSASIIYGVAIHKFIDVMYKTSGNFKIAREESIESFNVTKSQKVPKGKEYLLDQRHMEIVATNIWLQYIEEEEKNFSLITIPQKCFWCGGSGVIEHCNSECSGVTNVVSCEHCSGAGIINGPATELNFHFMFYEDEAIKVYLCGTIDRIGKIAGGCFAIRDWKTTGSWNTEQYFRRYEMSRQLRLYILACKLMAEREPDSILGKIGATKMGAFIDAIFLDKSPNESKVASSEMFSYSNQELQEFKEQLIDWCGYVSNAVQFNSFPKQGILNGTCVQPYGECKFWNVCKNNDMVATLLLKREFTQREYNPLNFNGEE